MTRDFLDWINMSTSFLTAVATLATGIVLFYFQFLKKIRIEYELSQTSIFEGGKIVFQVHNPSILFNRIIKNIYLVLDDYFIVDLINPENFSVVTAP